MLDSARDSGRGIGRRRLLLGGVAAIATIPTVSAGAPVHDSDPAGVPVAGSGVVVDREPTPLGFGQLLHAAFPGLCPMPDGSLHLVWRQGSDHVASRDGRIMRAVSWDCGDTYGPVTLLRNGSGVTGGVDYRDPSLAYVEGDTAYLTWFTGTAEAPAGGAYVMREWGATVRIDTLPHAAIAAPVVALPDGRLGAAFYGRRAGEPLDTAWMAWSDNGGRSWSTERVLDGLADGLVFTEPWLVVDGTTVHFFARWGTWDSLCVRSSSDSGGTWGPVRKILDSATGRPTVYVTTGGVLIMVYREIPSRGARIAYSVDHAATWKDGGVLMAPPAGSPLGMTYAAMAETMSGDVYVVLGMEDADGGSRLHHARLRVTAQPDSPRRTIR